MNRPRLVPIAAIAFATHGSAGASAAYTWTLDSEAWFREVGDVTSILFNDLGDLPVTVTDQYADLGWSAPPSSTFVALPLGYEDGAGITNFDPDAIPRVDFAAPIDTIGLEISGSVAVEFLLDGVPVEQTLLFAPGDPGEVGFIAFTTDFEFNSVVLTDFDASVYVDNFHFPAIPGPSAIGLLLAGGLAGPPRRRRI